LFPKRGAAPYATLERLVALADARGFLRTWPHRHGADAFFAARLVRA
jgi:16S rRNA C967 or C1407 C5-methylase (RsmB/RsmF family)